MVAVIEDRHHDIGKAADHRAVFVEEDGAHHLLDGDAALAVLRHDNKLHIRLRAVADRIIRTGTGLPAADRSEEHTSELQSLMRISYAVFCLKKKTKTKNK